MNAQKKPLRDPFLAPRFEEFSATRSAPQFPIAGIQKSGDLFLNSKAFTDLGEPEYARLYYDDGAKQIAIVPSDDPSDKVVRKQSASKSYLISAIAFSKHYKLDPYMAQHYRCQVEAGRRGDETIPYLIIDLNRSLGPAALSPRSRGRE